MYDNESGTPSHKKEPEPTNRKRMSHFEIWATIISIFSLAISAGGFWYVYKGLKASDASYATNTYLQTYGWTYQIDKTFINHPKLRRYFYDNKNIKKTDPDYAIAAATAELILDNLDAVLNNKSYFKENMAAKDSWEENTKDYFNRSPIICSIFKENTDYWPEIDTIVKKNCLIRK